MLIIYLYVIFLIMIFIGCIYVRDDEKKSWNNGNCPWCGEKWELYDVDSHGGRMYSCKNNHCCDISYKVDKIKIKEKK